MRRGLRLCLLGAALLVLGSRPTTSTPQIGDSASRPNDVTTLYPQDYSERWLDDDGFVWGPTLVAFDVRAYLTDNAPALLPYAEFISHWSGFYSISPKVILTVIDMQSGLVSDRAGARAADRPLGDLTGRVGFKEQVQTALEALYRDFYAFRAATGGTQPINGVNAATFALLNLFRAGSSPTVFSASVKSVRSDFISRYRQLFPASLQQGQALPKAAAADLPILQLPWRTDQFWKFNGVHTTTGIDPGVMSSIDFSRNWSPWGADTSSDFVTAANDGIVTVFSACQVRVTSPSGWATNYYHLDRIAVSNGMPVVSNQTLATYANNLPQALCQGGHSDVPHVHFSLLKDGFVAAISGIPLSGYIVHAGRYSYDRDPAYMWLERDGRHYLAYTDALSSQLPPGVSTAPEPPVDLTSSSTGSSVTLSWGPPANGAAPTNYFIEAGSGSGLSNLAAFFTGSVATTFSASGIASGAYYVRVKASNSAGTSLPSNETLLIVSGGCSQAPGAPAGLLVVSSSNGVVTLQWGASAGSPTSYVLEAGNVAGAAIYTSDLGTTSTTFTASGVGRGVYYVRLRGKNACGVGVPSNEVVVTVS